LQRLLPVMDPVMRSLCVYEHTNYRAFPRAYALAFGSYFYRFEKYDRFTRPANFVLAITWGLSAGIFFLLGGLLVLYMEVMKTFILS
jgi:hypothetical protein